MHQLTVVVPLPPPSGEEKTTIGIGPVGPRVASLACLLAAMLSVGVSEHGRGQRMPVFADGSVPPSPHTHTLNRLSAAAMSLPWLRGFLGVSNRRGADAKGLKDNSLAAAMLCKLAHVPSIVTTLGGAGVKAVLTAKCLMTRLIVKLQHAGLSAMVLAMSSWRSQCPAGDQRLVMVGIAHMWDDTTQRLREKRPAAGARQPRQKVGKTVLVQNTMVHSTAFELSQGGVAKFFTRAEHCSSA